jgi:hypothetical protein
MSSSADSRISSFGASHVWSTECMSRANKRISTLGATHVWGPNLHRYETLRAPSDEIRLMSLCQYQILTENWMEIWLWTSDEISIFTNDMQLNCAEYGFQTWLAATQGSRVLAFNIGLSVRNKTWKHDSLQMMKFVYCHSKYSLTVLNMGSKHDLRQLKKFVYLHSAYSVSELKMVSKYDLS